MLLAAEKAVLDGDQIQLETKAGRPNIGFWDNPAERIHWLVRIPQSGSYAVRGEFAAIEPSHVAIEVAEQRLTAAVPGTGGRERIRAVPLGELEFAKPGVYHLVLRPADPDSWQAVNVWQLQLALSQ